MNLTVAMTDGTWKPRPKKSRTVTVELKKIDSHESWQGHRLTDYAVLLDGKKVGRIKGSVENTDRHYNKIRVPGRGRRAWQWDRGNGERSSPGSYCSNLAQAVAELLGYSFGERI